jgi:hypothetical protein
MSSTGSAIGDGVATDLVYKSQHVTIMLAGVIIGRAQEISFQINKNIEKFHELGSSSPTYQEGELDFTGTLTALYFDQAKIRLAIGMDKDVVGRGGGVADVLTSAHTGVVTDPAASVMFGSVDSWKKGWKFDILVRLHRQGQGGVSGGSASDFGYTQFKLKRCMIDIYNFNVPLNRAVNERLDFVFHGIEGRRF